MKNKSFTLLLSAILADDRAHVATLLRADRELALATNNEATLYTSGIFHWLYVGDTALHFAAAGYRVEMVKRLLAAGADPNAARNHRHSTPLHYAADGYVSGPAWDSRRQVKTIQRLLDAGAEINAQDKNGATPLHRAVRTRCAKAVECLLDRGADPTTKNRAGSTPFHLAVQNTGRGGSGDEIAKRGQRAIIETFLAVGISPQLGDGRGKTVSDSATSSWIRDLLAGASN